VAHTLLSHLTRHAGIRVEQCGRNWPDTMHLSRVHLRLSLSEEEATYGSSSRESSRERRREQGRGESSIDMSVPKVGCV
jgi:hypothetical protein